MEKAVWTEEQIKLLKEKYPTTKTRDLAKELDKTFQQTVSKAHKSKLIKVGYFNECLYPEKIINESLESYYWIGFLMADGNIDSFGGIKLQLSVTEIEHLKKYTEYLGIKDIKIWKNGKFSRCYTRFNNKKVSKILQEKFKLIPRKTYNPPDLSYLEGDKFIAFLIGFIDGDGTIHLSNKNTNNASIRIKLHASWINNLNIFRNKLVIITGINNKKAYLKYEKEYRDSMKQNGYEASILYISQFMICKFLKKKAIEWQLPFLMRKWNKIQENLINRIERCDLNKKQILKAYQNGLKSKEISNLLIIPIWTCNKVILEYKRSVPV